MKQFTILGCWSDIKRFLGVWNNIIENIQNTHIIPFYIENLQCLNEKKYNVIHRVVSIMIDQLWIDNQIWTQAFNDYIENRKQFFGIDGVKRINGIKLKPRPIASDYISCSSKWIPRERSSYGWLYDYFVLAWAFKSGWKGDSKKFKVLDHWRCKFRKIVVSLYREYKNSLDCSSYISLKSDDLLEPKDCVKNMIVKSPILKKTSLDYEIFNMKWSKLLEQFCLYCQLPLDTTLS